MMRGIRRKQQWEMLRAMTCVIVCVLMSVSISYSQVSTERKTDKQLYEISGHLTALNLKEKWALIDDRRWELSEHFNTEGLPPKWIKKGSYECKNRWIVIRYYVSLPIRSEAPPDIGESTKGKQVRKVIRSKEIQEIFERGGKIYRIEVMPA